MERMLGRKRNIAIFVLPALLIFLCFTIVPLFISGFYSLFEYDGIGKMNFVGLQNYIETLTKDAYFLGAVKNSWILAGSDCSSSGAGTGAWSEGRTVLPDNLLCAGGDFKYGNRSAVDENFSQRVRSAQYFP